MNIPFQLRIVAYTRDESGAVSVVDIIDTSRRNAPYFARRIVARDTEAQGIGVCKPIDRFPTAEQIRWFK